MSIRTSHKIPADMIPHKSVNKPFRWDHVYPGFGIRIEEDPNGILTISAKGIEGGDNIVIDYNEETGSMTINAEGLVRTSDLRAGDNIRIDRDEETGAIIISSTDTATVITNGDNIILYVNEEDGTVVIDTIVDDEDSHYKGVFATIDGLLAAVPEPEQSDYALIKEVVFNESGRAWTGYYKYVVYIEGEWVVVDQLLIFTTDTDLIKQYYSVGGKSHAIYLHEIARTGSYNSLSDKPIVATPKLSFDGRYLSAACSTPGAVIWYRMFDADQQSEPELAYPFEGAEPYRLPIDLRDQGNKILRFVATKNGLINSEEAVYVIEKDKIPEINLDYTSNGIYFQTKNGECVCFTVDGSDPNHDSFKTDYSTDRPLDFPESWYYVDDSVETITVRASFGSPDNPIVERTFRRIPAVGISYTYRHKDGAISMLASRSSREPENVVIKYELARIEDAETVPDTLAVYDVIDDYPSSGIYRNVVETGHNILDDRNHDFVYCARVFCEGWLFSHLSYKQLPLLTQTAPVITSSPSVLSNSPDTRTVELKATGFDLDVFNVTFRGTYDSYNTDRILYTLNGSTPQYSVGAGGEIIPGQNTYLYDGPFEASQYILIHALCVCYGEFNSPQAVDTAGGLVLVPRGASKWSFVFDFPEGVNLEYSIGGHTWNPIESGVPVQVPAALPVFLRGHNPSGLSVLAAGQEPQTTHFNSEGVLYPLFYGSITRLLEPDGVVSQASLVGYTFAGLFEGTNIMRAPRADLSFGSGTLPPMCYYRTFAETTNLQGAVDLPSEYPTDECYKEMFDGSSVEEITVHAKIWAGAATNWLNHAISTGVIRKPHRTSMPSGVSGIPDGWTVENI